MNKIINLLAGDKSLEETKKELFELSKTYDLVELSIPFSDPIAQGNTHQEANARALKRFNGSGIPMILKMIQEEGRRRVLKEPITKELSTEDSNKIGLNVSVTVTLSVAIAGSLPRFWIIKVYVNRPFSLIVVGHIDLEIVNLAPLSAVIVSSTVISVMPPPLITAVFVIVPSRFKGAY